MKKAFIFPGQGAQKVGMGKDLFDAFDCVKKVYAEAEALVDFDLKGVTFEGSQEELNQTNRAQPAILTLSVALSRLMFEKGITPSVCAGHSLGEYAALVIAEVLSFEEALKLVLVRGELMMQAGKDTPGTMAALIGGSVPIVENLCQQVADTGYCAVANFNSPDQLVVSGEHVAIEKIIALSKDAGIKRAIPLAVSGGFHSQLMDSAAQGYVAALANAPLQAPKIPLFFNVDAKSAETPDTIRANMSAQINSPVQWVKTLTTIIAGNYADTGLELGPGSVLKGLARKIDAGFKVASINNVKSLESYLSA